MDGRRGVRPRWSVMLYVALVMTAGMLAACGNETAENADGRGGEGRILVVGSSTIAPLMSEIAKAYEADHPGVRIEVQAGGSSRGVLDVRQGVAELGMVSRALAEDEADLDRVLVARDGVGLVVHRDNPVSQLSRKQVIGIYTGAIGNWRDVGGPDLPITVVSKAEGRSTLEIFVEHFGIVYRDIRADVVIGDNQQGIQTVAGAPGAIGYVSIGTAEYEAGAGVPIRLMPLDGEMPSTAAVASGDYGMSRELNLVYRPPLDERIAGLLSYARSAEAARVARGQFFVPASD